jgi:hypothetical protein
MHGVVTCGSLAAGLRTKALANLQFSRIRAGILLFMHGVYAPGISWKMHPKEPVDRVRATSP